MKLLLTSAGLSNLSISLALFDLVGKGSEETKVVFIPTAANVETGDKDWFINDLVNLQKQNFKQIDIADISAVPIEIWKPKVLEADVIFFEGGNTYYLMEWLNKSGLAGELPELLKTRVYVGVSAGSMVTGPDLALSLSQIIYGEDLDKTENIKGLGFANFYFLPHLNSAYFPKLRKGDIQDAIAGITAKVYALDDQSALKVVNNKVEVVSEGQYFEFN